MACGLEPAAAAALWPRVLLSTRRGAAVAKGRPHQVACMNQFHCKLALSAAQSQRSRSLVSCTCSGSSAEAATSSRPADFSSSNNDLSMRDCVDAVPGAHIVISGYWTGPEMDDGCGHVQATLQRIV